MTDYNIDDEASLKGIKIICWNVCSLSNKFVEFEVIMDKMAPDIVCVSETWLGKTIPNTLISIPNNHLFRQDRTTPKKGGGLCVY